MLFLWLVDGFMHLAADGSGFKFTEQRCTACFQECRQSFSDPICKSRFLSFSHIISRCIYNKDLFFLQLSCDLRRTAPGKTKRVDFTYCFGGWLVNQPFLFIIRVFSYAQTEQRKILACRYLLWPAIPHGFSWKSAPHTTRWKYCGRASSPRRHRSRCLLSPVWR